VADDEKAVQNTKSEQVFEDEVHPATERTDQPAEEASERYDHGKNFSGNDQIYLCAKSFISQVYDLLARHSGRGTESVQERNTLKSLYCGTFLSLSVLW
jgi:hypothetical protein